MVDQSSSPPAPGQVVTPSPLNMTVQLDIIEGPMAKLVQVRVFTPQGVTFLFLDPEMAQMIGTQLAEAGKTASSPLTLLPRGAVLR